MYTFLIVSSVLAVFITLIPDIFPYCSCCRKKKFRPFFKLHVPVSFKLWYGGYKSVCRKCCRKYYINSIDDLNNVLRLKKYTEAKIKSEF